MADVSDYSEYDDSMMDDDEDGSDFYDSENPSPVVAKKKGGAAVRVRVARCVCVSVLVPLWMRWSVVMIVRRPFRSRTRATTTTRMENERYS
jgi:hypothetical protein